jgi:hypothetical protein
MFKKQVFAYWTVWIPGPNPGGRAGRANWKKDLVTGRIRVSVPFKPTARRACCRPASSRIRPANDRETSRNDGNRWSIESAGQEPDSTIAAGSEDSAPSPV